MAEKIKVWSKQHESVALKLESTGRYTAKREFIVRDLNEHAHLVLEVYDWLVANSPTAYLRPADAEYPIWLSLAREATMLPSPGSVILELEIDPAIISKVHIAKWGTMLNYSYIPADERDLAAHRELLEQYGVSDAKAFMTQFYPQIKREIVASWQRLFDDSIQLGSPGYYGNIWEVKSEWVTRIIK